MLIVQRQYFSVFVVIYSETVFLSVCCYLFRDSISQCLLLYIQRQYFSVFVVIYSETVFLSVCCYLFRDSISQCLLVFIQRQYFSVFVVICQGRVVGNYIHNMGRRGIARGQGKCWCNQHMECTCLGEPHVDISIMPTRNSYQEQENNAKEPGILDSTRLVKTTWK